MAPVRKTVASAAATVALLATVASCRPAPGGPPGGGSPQPTTSASASPTSSPTPGPTLSPTATPTAAPTTPASPTATPPKPTDPPRTDPPKPPDPTIPPPTTAPTTPPGTTAPQPVSQADEVVRLTNVERERAGCGPLAVDQSLTAAAQAHTADMAENNYFSHDGRDGSSPGDRARAAGFPSSYVGENIAAGSSTPAGTIEMWMNSDGHRANILNCEYSHIGVGYAEGGSYRYYWTQDFGKR